MYDPFSDDPRFAVQKISMCPHSEMLLIGGTAGQVIVLQFEREVHQQVDPYSNFGDDAGKNQSYILLSRLINCPMFGFCYNWSSLNCIFRTFSRYFCNNSLAILKCTNTVNQSQRKPWSPHVGQRSPT